MSRYRTPLLTSLGVLAVVLMLARCGSSPRIASQGESLSAEKVDSDQAQPSGEENLCDTQGEPCSNEDGAENPCVSFSSDIQPIFDNRCINCHNSTMMLGGLDLSACSSYANLVNQPTSPTCRMTVPDSIRVVPCDPPSSMLWLKTRPDPARCGQPMPRGTAGLGVIAPAEFLLLETWIAQGAQNN